jgi:hypothetical protein
LPVGAIFYARDDGYRLEYWLTGCPAEGMVKLTIIPGSCTTSLFAEMFGTVVLGIADEAFENLLLNLTKIYKLNRDG